MIHGRSGVQGLAAGEDPAAIIFSLADEARREMEQAILEARNNPDPQKQAEFRKRFGDRIPTPEEFIYVVAKEIKKDK